MEQLHQTYQLAQEALRAGRLDQAAAHVRAAGRELDAILDALAMQSGRDRQALGLPPRPPLRRKAEPTVIDERSVDAVRTEVLELMTRMRDLADEVLTKRREIRERRQWTAGQETAVPAAERGCVDISR